MPIACPQPVYPIDAPVAELRTAEVILAVTLRLWVRRVQNPDGDTPDWRGGFAAAEAEAAAVPAFDGLLDIVARTARRTLDVRCPQCLRLGADEGRLLQIVSLLQRDRIGDAEAILADWLPPAAVSVALLTAQGLAQALARSDLVVPLRHCEAAMPRQPLAAQADRGLMLVQ